MTPPIIFLMSLPPACAEPCPEAPEVTCRLAPGDHPEHFGGYGTEARSWLNTAYVPPEAPPDLSGAAKAKAHLVAMARRLREAQ
jgi:hypothetical protein